MQNRDEALILANRISAAGVSQIEVAARTGISQSQVSRLLSGTAKRRSKLFDRLCIYADSLPDGAQGAPDASELLIYSAVRETWDGTKKHAIALANVIRALSELTPTDRGQS